MVNPGFDVETVAEQVGAQGVDKLVTDAERICTHEQRRIACTNEPEIVRLDVEFAIQLAEQRRIANGFIRTARLRCARQILYQRRGSETNVKNDWPHLIDPFV